MSLRFILSCLLLAPASFVNASEQEVRADVLASLLDQGSTMTVIQAGVTIRLAQYLASKMAQPDEAKPASASFQNRCTKDSSPLKCSLYVTSSRNEPSPFDPKKTSRRIFERHILQYEARETQQGFEILTNPINVIILE